MIRKLILAATATVLVAAGACAKAGDEATLLTGDAALTALRAAPDAAAEAGSARFEMTITVDTPQGEFEMLASGGYSGDQAVIEMDLGSMMAQLAELTGETVPGGLDQSMQMVADGTDFYLRWPMLEQITGTAGWISMSAEDLGMASSSLGFGAGTNDPSQFLETLRGTSDDLEEIGSEEIRGVATTHLRATIDIDRALAEMPSDQRELLAPQLEGIDPGGSGFPVDAWIDADGLPRRLSMDFSSLAAAMGSGGSASVSIDFFDYGEPVEVVVPDPADTTPFGDVMGAFGGFG